MPAADEAFTLSVMTHHHTTSDGVAHRTSSLLRRVDGIEYPVAGTWTVPGSHATISFLVPRLLRRRKRLAGRSREATLVFCDDPAEVLVAVLLDAPRLGIAGSTSPAPAIRLEGRSVPGPHRWLLSGAVVTETGAVPLRATLGYHGVWRRGDRRYGRFVLIGVIDPHANTTPRRLKFSFDFLAYGPAAARPAQAPTPSPSMPAAGQTPEAA